MKKIDGPKVRNLRDLKGWSQEDLGDATGLSLRTVSAIEGNKHCPRPTTVQALAKGLGVDVSDLLCDDQDTPRAGTAGPASLGLGNRGQSFRSANLIVARFQKRFEQLVFRHQVVVATGGACVGKYYRLFWYLQLDQYHAWKRGEIPDEEYSFWMNERHVEWSENEVLAGVSYRRGWKRVVAHRGWRGTEFHQFMEEVFRGKHEMLLRFRATPAEAAGG